ncbi:hypothetical protein ACFSQE_02400 [Vogesella fluminis]
MDNAVSSRDTTLAWPVFIPGLLLICSLLAWSVLLPGSAEHTFYRRSSG